MTLGEKQRAFVLNVGKLIIWSYGNGYELTFGEATRDPRVAQLNAAEGKGIADTLHNRRLAVDLNLFLKGVYQAQSAAYGPLGDYWKSLHSLNCWGGDFRPMPDGNHFSMTDGGIK